MSQPRATGRCLCGAVRYEVRGQLRDILVCHCEECRRWCGYVGAFSAARLEDFALIEDRSVRWIDSPRSDRRARRGFCGECGASLFWQPAESERISIAAGTLDQPTGLRIAGHFYAHQAGDYDTLPEDGLPTYPDPAAPEVPVAMSPTSSHVNELLARPRYEVIPLAGAEEAVLEHVPTEVKLTITTSPRKGLEPTLELTERIAEQGYEVVPHLAARHVRDRVHLAELVERLRATGANDVLVMAGDAEEPAGEFDGSLPLLRALAELGHPFRDVGITGYPESHAFISDDATIRSMFDKEEFATYIVSQICFDPQVTAAWMAAVWKRGTQLPIHIGLPGPISRTKLLRVSARVGVGDSMRFLRTRRGWLRRTLSGDFDPDPLIRGLDGSVGYSRPNLGGFHIFTFNEVGSTERWRQRALGRLPNSG